MRYTLPATLQTTSAACSSQSYIEIQACTSATACSTACTFGPWTAWGACSKPCGGGTQYQTRTLVSGAAASCGPMLQVQLCNTQACV